MNYRIVTAGSVFDLEEQVKRLMRVSWVPVGGIIVYGVSVTFAQAMICKPSDD